jgi:hypothetical protein
LNLKLFPEEKTQMALAVFEILKRLSRVTVDQMIDDCDYLCEKHIILPNSETATVHPRSKLRGIAFKNNKKIVPTIALSPSLFNLLQLGL